MPSVAVITYDNTPIPFSALTVPQSVVMTSGLSTPLSGAIDYWRWYLLDKPPGSTASLLNSTTATCTLQNIDIPGNYRVFLVVRDSALNFSFSSPNQLQSGTTPFAFTSPNATAFAVVSATTQHKDLQLTAYGERNWFTNGYWPVVRAVDELFGLVGSTMGGGDTLFAKWVMPQAGDAAADGSEGNPYNLTSAAAGGFGGPWDQAVSELALLDISANPVIGRTIVAMAGEYDEDVTIANADAPWAVLCRGTVSFVSGHFFSYSVAAAGHLATPDLRIGADGSGYFSFGGQLRLGDPTGTQWSQWFEDCYFTTAVVATSLVANSEAYFKNVSFGGAFNIPNLRIRESVSGLHQGSITVQKMDKIERCAFESITVSQSSSLDGAGFYDCDFAGGGVFTGPAGSAQFDPITRARFAAAAFTYAGGAGVDDILRVGALISDEAQFSVRADVGHLGLTAATNVTIGANAGYVSIEAVGAGNDVTITADDAITATALGAVAVTGATGVGLEATGAGASVSLLTTNGAISLAANGVVGGDVTVEADDAITASAAGTMTLETTGPNKALTLITTDGTIAIDANGATHQVNVTADGNINTTSGGLTTIATTGVASSLFLQTTDGQIIIDCNGASRSVSISSEGTYGSQSAGDSNISTTGTGSDVNLFTTDGDITLNAGGASRNVQLGADNNITATAGDAVSIEAQGGAVTIQATGASQDVIVAADGDVDLSSNLDIRATSVGVVTLHTTGANKALTLITDDGNIVIDANGSGRDVIVTADDAITSTSAGLTTISTTGAASTLTLQTTDAAIVLNAVGSGRDVSITSGDDINLTAYDKVIVEAGSVDVRTTLYSYPGGAASGYPVANKIGDDGTSATTPGTAIHTFKTYTIPANFFSSSGNYVEGDAYFQTAGGTDAKRMGIYVDGVKVFAVDEADNDFNAKNVKIEYKLWKTGTANDLCGWYRVSWATAKIPSFVEEVLLGIACTTASACDITVRAQSVVTLGDITYLGSSLRA